MAPQAQPAVALSHLTVVACCSPYFVAAALRLALHCAKKPVAPPSVDGGPTRAIRPGTPFNPVHPVILMLACRADELNTVSWTATFWPLWTVFALLGVPVGRCLYLLCDKLRLPLNSGRSKLS